LINFVHFRKGRDGRDNKRKSWATNRRKTANYKYTKTYFDWEGNFQILNN